MIGLANVTEVAVASKASMSDGSFADVVLRLIVWCFVVDIGSGVGDVLRRISFILLNFGSRFLVNFFQVLLCKFFDDCGRRRLLIARSRRWQVSALPIKPHTCPSSMPRVPRIAEAH